MAEVQPVEKSAKAGLLEVIKKIPPISNFLRAHNLGRDLAQGKGGLLQGIGKTIAGFAGGAVTAFFGLQVGALGALFLAATPGLAGGMPPLAIATFAAGVCCAAAGTWVCSFSSGLLLQSTDNVGTGVRNAGQGLIKAVVPANKKQGPAVCGPAPEAQPILTVVPDPLPPANDDKPLAKAMDFNSVALPQNPPARRVLKAHSPYGDKKIAVGGKFGGFFK